MAQPPSCSTNLESMKYLQVRKDGFKDNPSVPEELDLVEEDDQFTHMLMTDDVTGGEEILNVFKFDPEYAANEEKYKSIKRELLDQVCTGWGISLRTWFGLTWIWRVPRLVGR